MLLKTGCIILSIWSVLNALASLFVVIIPVIIHDSNAPALLDSIDAFELNSISHQFISNANGIAVFANGVNFSFCTLLLFAIWFGLYRKIKWAFWAISSSLLCILLTGIAADAVVGYLHPEVNIISGIILGLGALASAIVLFNKNDT